MSIHTYIHTYKLIKLPYFIFTRHGADKVCPSILLPDKRNNPRSFHDTPNAPDKSNNPRRLHGTPIHLFVLSQFHPIPNALRAWQTWSTGYEAGFESPPPRKLAAVAARWDAFQLHRALVGYLLSTGSTGQFFGFSFRVFSFSVSKNINSIEIDGHGSTGVEL